jgi:hypothetical protein
MPCKFARSVGWPPKHSGLMWSTSADIARWPHALPSLQNGWSRTTCLRIAIQRDPRTLPVLLSEAFCALRR